MKPEEELIQLRAENQALRERLAQRDELIAQLLQHLQLLEERVAKDGHNSSLPPSSDRFGRQKKTRSLRTSSGKKAGDSKDTRVQPLREVRPLMKSSRCQFERATIARLI